MSCYLEVRGFHLRRGYLFKEVAAVGCDGSTIHTWVFRPPQPWASLTYEDKSSVRRSEIGLAWNDGTVPHSSVERVFEILARQYTVWVVG